VRRKLEAQSKQVADETIERLRKSKSNNA